MGRVNTVLFNNKLFCSIDLVLIRNMLYLFSCINTKCLSKKRYKKYLSLKSDVSCLNGNNTKQIYTLTYYIIKDLQYHYTYCRESLRFSLTSLFPAFISLFKQQI